MHNLETLISDMKAIRTISREHGNTATQPIIREITSTYADTIDTWIIRLEEANRLGDMNRPREEYFTSLFAD